MKNWPQRVVGGLSLLVVLGLLAVGGTWSVVKKRFDRAAQLATAADSVGEPAWFEEGKVPGNRLEAFLTVRRAVAPSCPGLERSGSAIRSQLDQGTDRRPSLGEVGKFGGAALGLIGEVSGYLDRRGLEMQRQGMGSAEYRTIYWMLYGSRLAEATSGVFAGAADRSQQQRRQAREDLESWAGRATDSHVADRVLTEARRLAESEDSLPWDAGVPEDLLAVAPEILEDAQGLFCEELPMLDFAEIETTKLGVRVRYGGSTLRVLAGPGASTSRDPGQSAEPNR